MKLEFPTRNYNCSDKYKIIFIHVPRTGGGTINNLLEIPREEQAHRAPWEIRLGIDPGKWEEYDKVVMCRNPWDRMVSMYYHSIKHENVKDEFSLKYIQRIGAVRFPLKYHLDNSRVDFIIQFQNLEEGVKHVMNKLNVHNYELPHHNHDTDRPKKSYRDFYNEETKNYIAEKFAWDIEKFGYKF